MVYTTHISKYIPMDSKKIEYSMQPSDDFQRDDWSNRPCLKSVGYGDDDAHSESNVEGNGCFEVGDR